MDSRKHLTSKSTVIAGSILVLISLALLLQPEVVSIYWHLRFGDTTAFDSWRIDVPRGWWAFNKENGLIIQRINRFYDRGEPEEIIVSTLRPAKPMELDALKNAAIQMYLKKGATLKGDRPIQVGDKPGYCLQFALSQRDAQTRITCDSLDAQLSFDYFGSPSHIQTFYSVIDQAKKFRGASPK